MISGPALAIEVNDLVLGLELKLQYPADGLRVPLPVSLQPNCLNLPAQSLTSFSRCNCQILPEVHRFPTSCPGGHPGGGDAQRDVVGGSRCFFLFPTGPAPGSQVGGECSSLVGRGGAQRSLQRGDLQ